MSSYWILFIAIALVSYLVQANLNNKFKKYSRIPLGNGMTGREVAGCADYTYIVNTIVV